jgi:hypothetical protein
MELPGGLWESGQRRRHVAFRRITGDLELAIAEHQDEPLPARVTAARVAALADLGGAPPTAQRVDALCVDDRRWLMQRLAGALGIGAVWLSAMCDDCGEPFDVRVDLDELPVKPARDGFPFAAVPTVAGAVRARVPTGADQAAIAGDGTDDPVAALLRRCVEGPEPEGADADRVQAAIEAVSPEVTREVQTACPACGHPAWVEIDPYVALRLDLDGLLDDVDALARTYCWTEPDVLRLPRDRRRRYLARAGVGSAP